MNNRRLLVIAITLATSCAPLVYAAERSFSLEEVIVTAQKTEETIQSVPISIQAMDEKTLANNSINSFSDVKALIPALKFSPMPTAQENLLVAIRGISAGAVELPQDTPAAVHINGVYIARGNGLNMSAADLERIEVLRGPQGTLYGRNATAGAINIITAKPKSEFSFKQQITLADHNQKLAKTSINIPIADKLYSKISYLYDDKDGYIKNDAPGGMDFGARNAQAARFDLRWEPLSNLTIDYGYDWSHNRYNATPGQCMQQGTVMTLGTLMDPADCGTHFKDRISFYGHVPKNTVTTQGHTLNVEWDAGWATLRSITAYRDLNDNYYGILFGGGPNITGGSVDYYGAGLALPAQSNHTRQDQFSQEFQLLGDIGEQLSYSTGLYFFKENGSETKGYGASLIRVIDPTTTMISMNGPRDLSVDNKSWAVFGQLTWTPPILDNNLEIIPGLRYTRDSRQASMFEKRGGSYIVTPAGAILDETSPQNKPTYTGYPDAPNAFTGTPAQFDKDFSKTTPSLTVQYHVNEDLMTYAKWVKGYKSGGTAVRASTTAAFETGFNPETLTSIELGFKSTWLDQRLRINADVFQSKFKDQQVSVRNAELAAANPSNPAVPFDIVNAGRSTYQGAELEIQAALTENLRVGANYAYLHFKYDKVEDPASGLDVTRFYHNVVPTNSYSLQADYTRNLDIGTLGLNLTYSHTDRTSGPFQDSYSTPGGVVTPSLIADQRQFVTPSYGIWNGRISLSDIGVGDSGKSSLSVALWAKNLTDEKYSSYNFVTIGQAAQYQAFWGEPRTLGVDLIYKYE